ISVVARFAGKLDVAVLEQAISEGVRRHEVLRTTFAPGEKAVAVVSEASPVSVPIAGWEALAKAEGEAAAGKAAVLAVQQPFDLSRGPLLRAKLFELDPEHHILLLMMHHIASDGWTMGLLTSEIAALYQAFAAGAPSPLPELPIQYADYARWQRQWL